MVAPSRIPWIFWEDPRIGFMARIILIAQFLNTGVNVALVAWTIRFTTKRLERYRPLV